MWSRPAPPSSTGHVGATHPRSPSLRVSVSVDAVAGATFVLDHCTGDVPRDEFLGLNSDAAPVRGFGEVHSLSDLP